MSDMKNYYLLGELRGEYFVIVQRDSPIRLKKLPYTIGIYKTRRGAVNAVSKLIRHRIKNIESVITKLEKNLQSIKNGKLTSSKGKTK